MKARQLFFPVVAVIVIVALWVLFKPQEEANKPVLDQPEQLQEEQTVQVIDEVVIPAEPKVIEAAYVLRNGQIEQGTDAIKVTQGETIVLRIDSDKDDSLHMHGYDLHLHVHAGKPAELKFVAEHTGRFDFELHKSHITLGAIEVYPK